jgi:hypothetical protein
MDHTHFEMNEHLKHIQEILAIANELLSDGFAELRNVPISIMPMNTKFTMAAFPIPFRSRRGYCLILGFGQRNQVPWKDVPQRARKGLVAHELCHFVQYKSMGKWQLARHCIRYALSRSYRKRTEYATDSMVIDRGLGKELFSWARHSAYNESNSEEYRRYKLMHYLTPIEIKRRLKERGEWTPDL